MIPAVAHFIWIGSDFPWLHFAALASAAKNGGFSRVVLHHSDDLSHAPWWRALGGLGNVESRRLSPARLIERVGGSALVARYSALAERAAQSNVLRVAILLQEGGVYLDLDTVTTKSLTSFRQTSSFFCGAERIAFPASLERSKNPLPWASAFLRTSLRDLARRSAHGVHWFRRVQHLYPLAANNAVLGATPNHPFVHELCQRMLALSERESLRRYALGTSLLQHALHETTSSEIVVHPPAAFYPLGPELSQHWFRMDGRARLDDVLDANTHVVHWYASVRTRNIAPSINPAWVERHRHQQLLSALLSRALGAELFPVAREAALSGKEHAA